MQISNRSKERGWGGGGAVFIKDSHSGAIQFGRNTFWSSMKENRVWAMSILAVISSSIYRIAVKVTREGRGGVEVREEWRRGRKGGEGGRDGGEECEVEKLGGHTKTQKGFKSNPQMSGSRLCR